MDQRIKDKPKPPIRRSWGINHPQLTRQVKSDWHEWCMVVVRNNAPNRSSSMADLIGHQKYVSSLKRGDLVKAARYLEASGAKADELGVVFEESDGYGDGYGPMVRWVSGSCCNVYDNDVEKC